MATWNMTVAVDGLPNDPAEQGDAHAAGYAVAVALHASIAEHFPDEVAAGQVAVTNSLAWPPESVQPAPEA